MVHKEGWEVSAKHHGFRVDKVEYKRRRARRTR